jgi:hypothetical protein
MACHKSTEGVDQLPCNAASVTRSFLPGRLGSAWRQMRQITWPN